MVSTLPCGSLDERFSSPDAIPTPWEDALDVLANAGVYWLSTGRQDGQPHVTPIAGVVYEGELYFCTGPGEQKSFNLARNPRCALTAGCSHFEQGIDVVFEGEIARVKSQYLLKALATEYERKYDGFFGFAVGDGCFVNAGGGTALVYQVVADKAFAFAKGEKFSQTRWHLPHPYPSGPS